VQIETGPYASVLVRLDDDRAAEFAQDAPDLRAARGSPSSPSPICSRYSSAAPAPSALHAPVPISSGVRLTETTAWARLEVTDMSDEQTGRANAHCSLTAVSYSQRLARYVPFPDHELASVDETKSLLAR